MKKISYIILITLLVVFTIYNTNLKLVWFKYAIFGATILIYFYLSIKATQEDKYEKNYSLMKKTKYIFWTTLFVSLIMVAITIRINWLKYTMLVTSVTPYFLLIMEALKE